MSVLYVGMAGAQWLRRGGGDSGPGFASEVRGLPSCACITVHTVAEQRPTGQRRPEVGVRWSGILRSVRVRLRRRVRGRGGRRGAVTCLCRRSLPALPGALLGC